MSYRDDDVLAKLSALNETQESIVTVAQWVMFHRRNADRTGQLWLQRLKDSGTNKRLNLIYLANEVVQQSKARKKDEFLIAFTPVIAEATATAYKGATNEVQQKLRRVVEVWRQRQIFEPSIQEVIESRIDELDRSRGGAKTGLIGGGIFSRGAASTPSELVPLVAPQQTVTKLVLSTKTSLNAANTDYDKYTDPNAVTPSAPVYAARLNGLLKNLANAEGAVAEVIKARMTLIDSLEKLLEANKSSLEADNKQLEELSTRRDLIDTKKREVEDSIMRGFATNSPSTPNIDGSPAADSETPAPEVEALTPPTYEAISPQSPPPLDYPLVEESTNLAAPRNEDEGYSPMQPAVGSDLLASLAGGQYGQNRSVANGSVKKRKLDTSNDLGGEDGDMDDLDPEVAAMLRGD